MVPAKALELIDTKTSHIIQMIEIHKNITNWKIWHLPRKDKIHREAVEVQSKNDLD